MTTTTTTYNPGKRPAILDVAGLEFGPRCTCCGTPEEASIRGFGNPKAKLMEVGIAPGRQEMQWGAPLVGPSGKRNDLCLGAVKIERKKVYATNLCCFWEDAPSEDEVGTCWPRLREEILTVRPRLMLSLGGLATSWLTGYSLGKVRGDLIRPEHNKSPHFAELRDLWEEGLPLPTILPTWHPAATLRIPSLTTDVLRDFWKIKPFLKGRLEPLRWTHEVVTSRKAAQAVLDSLAACPGLPVALDVETERDEANAFQRIVCVALAVPERLDLMDASLLADKTGGSLASASEADLETLCGHPEQTYRAWVFPVEVLRGLRWPHHVRWLEHNMQFDNPAIWRTFGVWLPVWRDTMLDSWARDERPGRDEDSQSERSRSGEASKPKGPGFHGLKQLASEYLGAEPGYGDEMKKFFKAGTIGEAERPRLYRYNAFDAVNTVALPGRLPRRPCGALMSLIMPAARAYARVHLTGIPVDLDRARQLQAEWEPWISELETDLQGAAFELGFRNPPKLKRDIAAKAAFEEQWGEGSWMGEPINLGSNPQLATLLYGILGLPVTVRSKKTAKPSVGAEAIASIDHPFVEKLEELRTAKHVKASHLDPVVNLARGDSQAVVASASKRSAGSQRARVHASIWVNGAVNYRRSITNPPMQQFPQEHPKPFWKRLAEVRSIIAPDPGFVLIEADYKQIELHGCARLSGDPVFLADLGTGDYHTKIVRDVFHVGADPSSVVFSHTRRLAKVFNFAVIYKVEENTLARTMNQALRDAGTGGPPVTPAAAGRLIRQWYARNRRVWEWHRELIAEVRRTGKLVNAFEEVRRFPLYDTSLDKQIVNWPVSSTCGAHSEISLIELEPIIRKDFGGSILFDTHDSLMFHVPTTQARAAAKVIKEVMEKPKIPGWAPLEVEFKASSTSWREMHEWKNLEEIPEWMVQRPRPARQPPSRQLTLSRR